jgi:O-antigen/teichoic acid export membrane protein
LKRLKNKIFASQLFKISSLNGVQVIIKVIGGLISSKVIALFLGPSGLALVGNFRNFLSSVDSFSTLGLQNGIIKYIAENKDDGDRLWKIISTVCTGIFFTIVFLSLLLAGLSTFWSQWIFDDNTEYKWLFNVLAFGLPWYTGNLILISILNGLGKYKQVIYINIWGNITGVAFSALLIWQWQINGALLGLVISPLFMFVLSFFQLKSHFRGVRINTLKTDYTLFKGLLSYSYMSLVTAVIGPVVYLALRNLLIETHGMEEAGYWEAINRISVFYMMFISTLLTVYFLPELSKVQSAYETKKIFYSYYKGIIPIFCAGLVVLYFVREPVVRLILSDEFIPVSDLFFWQLLGDFFKACSYILAFEFFAKKMTKAFIVTEITSFLILFISGYCLIPYFGSEGAVIAHVITYIAYLIILLIFFRHQVLYVKKE